MERGNLGFDFDSVVAAIEDRFLRSSVCSMVNGRPDQYVVDSLLDEHMLQHGLPVLFEMYGVLLPAPRCSVWPCPAAGLVFAAFELRWYAINASDEEEAALFERAAVRLPLGGELREEFGARARRRREALFSRPLQMRSPRRPPVALAQGVAQHLHSGGLSHPTIGELMGSTAEAARKRCAAPDVRSVMPYVEPEHRAAV